MAKDTFENGVDKSETVVETSTNPADGIYGTCERVRAAADRIKAGQIESGDLDTVFGHL